MVGVRGFEPPTPSSRIRRAGEISNNFRARQKGRLTIERIGGKDFATLAAINAIRAERRIGDPKRRGREPRFV